MKWQSDAEQAVSRVPFFVRKRVKKKVEQEAQNSGAKMVTLAHVKACQQRFIHNQEAEIKGFQVETCFGAGGCPNRINTDGERLVQELEGYLVGLDLKKFLKNRVNGPLKMHHELRISISDCPNSCSRPQIVDIGLIGANRPMTGAEPCSQCRACITACKEGAIFFGDQSAQPAIDPDACLACGQCVRQCPTTTLVEAETGFRILLGGKLGRHPQLGRELPGIYPAEEALAIIKQCVKHFMAHTKNGERFGAVLNRTGLPAFGPEQQ